MSAKARGSRRSKFAGIMLGDYERLAEEIRASLEGVGVRGVYFEDIAKSAERVRGWPKTAEPNRKGVGAVIETFKKRYHFTLWCDEDNDRVAGIVYTRIDRQPGATFYWVELDLTHPDDKSQFDAWKSYMGC